MKFNRRAYWEDTGVVTNYGGVPKEYNVQDALADVVEGSGLSSLEIRLDNLEKCVAFLLEETNQPMHVVNLLNSFGGYEERFIIAGSEP